MLRLSSLLKRLLIILVRSYGLAIGGFNVTSGGISHRQLKLLWFTCLKIPSFVLSMQSSVTSKILLVSLTLVILMTVVSILDISPLLPLVVSFVPRYQLTYLRC